MAKALAATLDDSLYVDVLLSLLHLGPTLLSFLSPNVAKVLIDNFGIGGITNVEDDMKMFMEA